MGKINKLISIIKDKLLPIYIIFNIVYILFCRYLCVSFRMTQKTVSLGLIVLMFLNLFIAIVLINKKYKRNKIDIFLLLIILFSLISTFFAYNFNTAVFGENGRYEGIFTICYYISLLFLSTYVKEKDKKMIVYTIILGGIIQLGYSFYYNQKYHFKYVIGFTTNPNFFGAYILMCLCYCIGLFLDNKNIYLKLLFIFLIYSFSLGLLAIDTLSALVGLIGVVCFLLIYSIKQKYIKQYIIIVLTLLLSIFLAHSLKMTTLLNDLFKTVNETTNIVSGDLSDSYGTGRLFVYKRTIPLIPRYALKGIGVDNFRYVLDGKAITNEYGIFDKAHNEYLQILITTGIFSLLSYLILHLIIVINGIKKSFKDKKIYLLLPIIGYLIQAQFSISVIEVAPIFYIGLGLLVEREN